MLHQKNLSWGAAVIEGAGGCRCAFARLKPSPRKSSVELFRGLGFSLARAQLTESIEACCRATVASSHGFMMLHGRGF